MPKIKTTAHLQYFTPPHSPQKRSERSPTDVKSSASARRAFSAPNTPRTTAHLSTPLALRETVEVLVLNPNSESPTPLRPSTPLREPHEQIAPPSPQELDSPPPGKCLGSTPQEGLLGALEQRTFSPPTPTADSLQTQTTDSPPRLHRRHQEFGEECKSATRQALTRQSDGVVRDDDEEKQPVHAQSNMSIEKSQYDSLVLACKEKQKNDKLLANKLIVVAQLVATVISATYLCPIGGALGYGLGTLAGFMGLFSSIEGKRFRFLMQLSALSLVLQREMINKSVLASFVPGFSSAVMIDGFGDIAKEAFKTSFYKEVIQALKTREFIAYLERKIPLSSQSITIDQVISQYKRFKWLEERQDKRSLAYIAQDATVQNLDNQLELSRFQKDQLTKHCETKASKPNQTLLNGTLKVATAACVAFLMGGGATLLATIGAGYVALDLCRRIYSKLKGDPYNIVALDLKEGRFAIYIQIKINEGHQIEFVKRNIVQFHNIYKQQYQSS